MDNYPSGNMTPTDPASPLHEELNTPGCDECGEELAIDADCDESGMFSIAYCENLECEEYGELL